MSERAKRNQEQTTISFAFAFVDNEQTTIPVLHSGTAKTQSQHTDIEQIEQNFVIL